MPPARGGNITPMSFTVMFIMAIQLAMLSIVRYVWIPFLAIVMYINAVLATIPVCIAFAFWCLSDAACDWIEKKGFTRPNQFPNLPW